MKKMKKEQIEEVIKTSWNRYYGLPEDSDNIRPSENFERGFKDGAEWRISSVWHDMSEIPKDGRMLLCISSLNAPLICGPDNSGFKYTAKYFGISCWAYIDDLIPEKEDR